MRTFAIFLLVGAGILRGQTSAYNTETVFGWENTSKADSSEAWFDFENTSKLNYDGAEEEILKKISCAVPLTIISPEDTIKETHNKSEISSQTATITISYPFLFLGERDPEGRPKPLRGITWIGSSGGCTIQNPSIGIPMDTVFIWSDESRKKTKSVKKVVVGENLPEYQKDHLKTSYHEISLDAFIVPNDVITVSAGSVKLIENIDFVIDRDFQKVNILNENILEAGLPFKISLERNSSFHVPQAGENIVGSVNETLFAGEKPIKQKVYISDDSTDEDLGETWQGTSVLYFSGMKVNPLPGQLKPGFGPIEKKITNRDRAADTNIKTKNIIIEKPLTQKVNVSDEPICTFIYGTELPCEAKKIDSLVRVLPAINTKERSPNNAINEFAKLIPGPVYLGVGTETRKNAEKVFWQLWIPFFCN